jgi:protein TonB
MSYLFNNQQKLNDLVFANRNKNYGAYAIRSAYGSTLLKSLSCVIFGFVALMLGAYYFSNKPSVKLDVLEPLQEIIYTTPVDLQPKVEPENKSDSQPAKKDLGNKSETNLLNLVVTDSLISETHTTTIENPVNIVSNNTNSVGSTEAAGGNNGTNSEKDTSDGAASSVKSDFEVDTQPEFEGGLAALRKFVALRLKYPEDAIDRGIQGTVCVKFVVDENGKVGNLSLENNIGFGLDEEAKRVVAMIPNFKSPAKSNGRPVKVYFRLPIKFKYR